MEDNSIFDNEGNSRLQKTAFRLDEMIGRLVGVADPDASVEVTLQDDEQSQKRLLCRIECDLDSLQEIVAICRHELHVVSQEDYASDQKVRFEVVNPSIVTGGITSSNAQPQLFTLEVVASKKLSTEKQDKANAVSKPVSLDLNYGMSKDEYTHVIALVHGIRDIGAWQSTVSAELASSGTVVSQIRFGLYPALRFLFPISLAGPPIRKVVQELNDLKNEYPKAKISVIAHSFGTYVLIRALRADPNLKLWKIVFCGSVMDDQFRWVELKHRVGDGERPTRDFIVNDCGTADHWPVVGSAFGWFYGMAGSTGFSESMIKNRFFRAKNGKGGGHSLYFDNGFVRNNWRPFLIDDKAPQNGDGTQGEHLSFLVRLLYHSWVRWICKLIAVLAWVGIPVVLLFGAVSVWRYFTS